MNTPQTKPDPIDLLAHVYSGDLEKINALSSMVIIDRDINILSSIAMKYGIDKTVTDKNFNQIKGEVAKKIIDRLENYVVGGMLKEKPLIQRPVLDQMKSNSQSDMPEVIPEEKTKVSDDV